MLALQIDKIVPISELGKRDSLLFHSAVEIAKESPFDYPRKMGSVIVGDYRGYNDKRTSVFGTKCLAIHAEVSSIITAKKHNRKKIGGNVSLHRKEDIGSEIFVTRLMSDEKTYGNSKPCDNCIRHLYNNGVCKIRYSDVLDTGVNVLVFSTLCRYN